MGALLLRRIAQAVLSVLVVSIAVFLVVRLSGDPVTILAPPEATAERIDEVRHALGLDRPLHVQYISYVSDTLRGDLGDSLAFNRPVADLIRDRFGATLTLGIVAMAIALLFSVPIGVYAAAKRGGRLDVVARGFAAIGQAVPPFWLGLMLILMFAVTLRVFPTSGNERPFAIVLPAITLGWFAAAGIMRLSRSSMLGVLGSEYIKLARIKGLPEWKVLWKHGFKNAALPVLTFAGLIMVNMVSGSVIVETVFSWPGIGLLVVDAARARDYPLVQGVVLLLSVLYIVANLVVDLLYVYLDPRLRRGES